VIPMCTNTSKHNVAEILRYLIEVALCFFHKSIHRRRTNRCDYIMKRTYAICTLLSIVSHYKGGVDIQFLVANSTKLNHLSATYVPLQATSARGLVWKTPTQKKAHCMPTFRCIHLLPFVSIHILPVSPLFTPGTLEYMCKWCKFCRKLS